MSCTEDGRDDLTPLVDLVSDTSKKEHCTAMSIKYDLIVVHESN